MFSRDNKSKKSLIKSIYGTKEIFRMLDELLYDSKEAVKDRAIKILLDIRTVVQNEDKEHIMKLTEINK
jgi:hypothetical protein